MTACAHCQRQLPEALVRAGHRRIGQSQGDNPKQQQHGAAGRLGAEETLKNCRLNSPRHKSNAVNAELAIRTVPSSRMRLKLARVSCRPKLLLPFPECPLVI